MLMSDVKPTTISFKYFLSTWITPKQRFSHENLFGVRPVAWLLVFKICSCVHIESHIGLVLNLKYCRIDRSTSLRAPSCRNIISSHGIVEEGWTNYCVPQGRFLTTCVISMLRNEGIWKVRMFSKIKSSWQVSIHIILAYLINILAWGIYRNKRLYSEEAKIQEALKINHYNTETV